MRGSSFVWTSSLPWALKWLFMGYSTLVGNHSQTSVCLREEPLVSRLFFISKRICNLCRSHQGPMVYVIGTTCQVSPSKYITIHTRLNANWKNLEAIQVLLEVSRFWPFIVWNAIFCTTFHWHDKLQLSTPIRKGTLICIFILEHWQN
jgi:hypothetical protein